ncbi:MAG TPA: hypothetical protein VKT73_12810 [Xanthobacteraceae bacterium]|nr:hypothetical protein [Xanthobacteraceae bacterium]
MTDKLLATLGAIEARVRPTFCPTTKFENDGPRKIIEGRISKDDFGVLFLAALSLYTGTGRPITDKLRAALENYWALVKEKIDRSYSRLPNSTYDAMLQEAKEALAVLSTVEISYEEAVKKRPAGACYCDLDDRECYQRGHWKPIDTAQSNTLRTALEAVKRIQSENNRAIRQFTNISNKLIADACKEAIEALAALPADTGQEAAMHRRCIEIVRAYRQEMAGQVYEAAAKAIEERLSAL